MKLLDLNIKGLTVNIILIRSIDFPNVIGKLVKKINGNYSFIKLSDIKISSSKFITVDGFEFTSVALMNHINK